MEIRCRKKLVKNMLGNGMFTTKINNNKFKKYISHIHLYYIKLKITTIIRNVKVQKRGRVTSYFYYCGQPFQTLKHDQLY